MKLTIEITKCKECRYRNHSGGLTVRGPRQTCGRSDACKVRKTTLEFKDEYPEYVAEMETDNWEGWEHHWYHRMTEEDIIPDWCPLKHGAKY